MNYLGLMFIVLPTCSRGLTYVPDAFEEDELLTDDIAKRKFVSCECGRQIDYSDDFREFVVIKMLSVDGSEVLKYCGGSIINDLFVLTTMSCVMEDSELNILDHVLRRKKIDHSRIRVYSRTMQNDSLSKAVALEVHSIMCHPYAFPSVVLNGTTDYDVCLIQLNQRLQMEGNDSVKTVCLLASVSTSRSIEDSNASLIEFVQTPDINLMDPVVQLRESEGIIFSRKDCETTSDRMNCFQTEESDNFGSPGSPVMATLVSGLVIQVGVSSYKSFLTESDKFQYCSMFEIFTDLASKEIQHFINTQSKLADARWCKYNRSSVGVKKVKKALVTNALKPKTMSYCWDRISQDIPLRHVSKACKCGLTKSSMKPLIVGGTETTPFEYGWQSQLVVTKLVAPNLEESQGCGGTVINSKFILTAGHCLAELNCQSVAEPSDVVVRLARHSGYLHNANTEGFSVKVTRIFCHPDFSQEIVVNNGESFKTLRRDIALLEMEDHLDFEEVTDIYPICLGESPMLDGIIGQSAIALGWGYTNQSNPNSLSDVLKELKVTVVENQVCKNILADFGYEIPEKVVCAGNFKPLSEYNEPFQGDSGGPLMLPVPVSVDTFKDDHYFVQIGLVSGGSLSIKKSPVPSDVPIVWYTSVAEYLPFIKYLSYQAEAVWCSKP